MELDFPLPQHQNLPSGAVTKPNEAPTPLTDLVAALEHAVQSAKHLASSAAAASHHASQTLAAIASIQSAHQMIGSFLAQLDSPPSAGDDPMSDCREGEEEVVGGGWDGSRIIDEVEEGMRECVLQSKRRKRRLSPSCPAGRAADLGEESSDIDLRDRRQSSLDLIFQFHA